MSTATLHPIDAGSITSIPGFDAAGVAAGIKANGALDVALVTSNRPCVAAAVFTTNAFKAAPVLYDQRILAENPSGIRAVVINAGCANACTGEQGMRNAEATAEAAAEALGIAPGDVMLMSTGVIGAQLPMDKLTRGVAAAAAQRSSSIDAGHDAARAIMTTDTRPKECAIRVTCEGASFTIGGMAKGAGMIHPNMATLLCLLTTDAAIAPDLAQRALRDAVDTSFNMITVDGDTSTNDTALLLANGTAAAAPITAADSLAYEAFFQGLTHVLTALAQGIVRDAEGATRFITITVRGAADAAAAKQVGMSVARSLLVKTAIYGRDANWGRIVCAVGYSGVPVDPSRVGVWLGDLELVRAGAPYDVNEERAAAILEQPDIAITVDLGQGSAAATVWTCDISHSYVDINAHYRT
ncbi:MAG TPA: bifunctional glutamate N-acetyltransferase/amino-acid acetyltransferase ArgJ [Chloroflexi bacterium]|jgi:glutamate N-acetyltransferase/amino-acid N-acetyltransferase|nr:bifunctional glutamate N-acetyltransferase/amino-acid acetyltransferase ArgJ [Chloroflexota bacterium]